MTFLHVSDLHIGKKLMGRSLIEDQRHILRQILQMAEGVDVVLVAGDLYDKAQPSAEALALASEFLCALAALKKPVLIVSGNHDSPEQVAYCRSILAGADVYVTSALSAAPNPVRLRDEYGEIFVYLLPFVRPTQARRAFPQRAEEIRSYADALRIAVEEMRIDASVRNVLVAHQFVVGDKTVLCDSEERMVGGVDAVPAEIFQNFDYVALGHLHTPQKVGSARIRYAGSPLKYSISEEKQRKAALRVTIGAKDAQIKVEQLPCHPLRDVRSLRGTLAELTQSTVPEMDYVFITLTDELPPIDAVGALQESYPNFVQMRRENSRSGDRDGTAVVQQMEQCDPLEHFLRFYRTQNNGQEPEAQQIRILKQIIQEAEEGLHAPD